MRKATLADADAIRGCLAAAFESFRAQYTAAGFRDTTLTADSVRQRLETMTLFVATAHDGAVIGTIGCSAHEKEGHIRGMAVLPRWQGHGVAPALLHAAEEDLRTRGCTHVTLDTTQPLLRAIAFYTREGYQASGKVGDFFGMALYEYVKRL